MFNLNGKVQIVWFVCIKQDFTQPYSKRKAKMLEARQILKAKNITYREEYKTEREAKTEAERVQKLTGVEMEHCEGSYL